MPTDRPDKSSRRAGSTSAFVLAIDFGGSKTAVATLDLRGRILASEILLFDATAESERILNDALDVGVRLIEMTEGGPCAAVGIATPGIPTPEGVLLSPNLPGWHGLRLAERVENVLGIGPVPVDNDVKCAALAEHRWGALRHADPALYLNLGSGVGAASVVGERILHGAHGGAGEIGYAASRIPESDAGSPTLEDVVGGKRMAQRASRLVGRQLTTSQVFDAVDAQLSQVVEEGLTTLAAHLRTLVLAFDPARVALGGGMMGHADRVLNVLRDRLRVPEPLGAEVVAGKFLYDAALRGAAALALDAIRGGSVG